LQERTGGFTEFVPLPFVHMEAPMYLKGMARKGPTFREAVLMHAVARLALHPVLTNIQVSWVKLGREGVRVCLKAGANDMGGTLMNESISRAAGTEHGQELPPLEMEALIRSLGRTFPSTQHRLWGGLRRTPRGGPQGRAAEPDYPDPAEIRPPQAGERLIRLLENEYTMTDTLPTLAILGGTGAEGSGLGFRWAHARLSRHPGQPLGRKGAGRRRRTEQAAGQRPRARHG
jgi:hypothetical protein